MRTLLPVTRLSAETAAYFLQVTREYAHSAHSILFARRVREILV